LEVQLQSLKIPDALIEAQSFAELSKKLFEVCIGFLEFYLDF
jgi:uncharacterized protein YfaA (DUF2138 family)